MLHLTKYSKLIYLYFIFFIFLVFYASVQMQKLPLWSYLPLVWLVGVLGALVSFSYLRMSVQARYYTILAILSGILLSAGFPPIPLFPLFLVGFVPLLYIEDSIYRKKTSKKTIFVYSYLTLLIWNIFTTYWVLNSTFVGGIIAILLNSLFMTLPFLCMHQIGRRTQNIFLKYSSFIAAWLAFEFGHERWDLSWSWLNLGNAPAMFPEWIQWYEWGGAPLGSFWILCTNTCIFLAYKQRTIRSRTIALSVSLIPILISILIYTTISIPTDQTVEIVAVQPNYEPHYEKFTIDDEVQVAKIIELARQKITPNTDYLVLPETSFGSVQRNKINENPYIRTLQKLLDSHPKLKIVTGIDAYYLYQTGEKLSPTARTTKNGDYIYDSYNAAIQLDTTPQIPFYIKSKLVPGPEKIPFPFLIHILGGLMEHWGAAAGSLATQKERAVFSSNSLNIAPVICYESIYSEYVSEYIRKNAHIIFIMTNDGWWDNTAGYRQHAYWGALRAIENRSPVVRAANTGTSCFIDIKGNIHQRTNYGEDAVIRSTVSPRSSMSFYSKYGDIISRLALIYFIVIIVFVVVKKKNT